ncbi:MAG: ADP-ribosylglycohydrolase family protein [Marivirga sp.]|nr:ADP-ribosylglycohydrolase family protein [Marivirga sp.]
MRLSPILVFLALVSCSKKQEIKETVSPTRSKSISVISEKTYHNKVLGLLIGSAIGDAMGAPTEMWNRSDIRTEYGFVNSLDTMVRAPSAEGTWKHNLPAGGTTDDTRWKKLFVSYATGQTWPGLQPKDFAEHIIKKYKTDIDALKATEGFDPQPYEENLMKMAWLQEWALVSDAYVKNDMVIYANALSKFYGGEMTCAGMLYSPLIGACVPSDPETSYNTAYNLSIFDIGYARDITSLVAAMVSQAFDSTADKNSLTNVIRTVDPNHYFNSRLVGRTSYRFYQIANTIVSTSKNLTLKNLPGDFRIDREWQSLDSLSYLQLSNAYTLLDKYNEDMPFHAAEIYLITLTAMSYADYDFEKTMEFIINYGRDNDTVAAVAGAILGAYLGADQLPVNKVNQILKVNKEHLGTDLEKLADEMTKKYLKESQ